MNILGRWSGKLMTLLVSESRSVTMTMVDKEECEDERSDNGE